MSPDLIDAELYQMSKFYEYYNLNNIAYCDFINELIKIGLTARKCETLIDNLDCVGLYTIKKHKNIYKRKFRLILIDIQGQYMYIDLNINDTLNFIVNRGIQFGKVD